MICINNISEYQLCIESTYIVFSPSGVVVVVVLVGWETSSTSRELVAVSGEVSPAVASSDTSGNSGNCVGQRTQDRRHGVPNEIQS